MADYLVKSEKTNYGSGNDTTSLYVSVREKSQSVENNQTVIGVGMWITSKYAIGTWSDNSSSSYVGTSTSGSGCYTFNGTVSYGSGSKVLLSEKEFTIAHNDDGSKTVRIYWKLNVNSSWGQYVYPSGYIDVQLTKIIRKATVISAENFTHEESPTIKFDNPGEFQVVPYITIYDRNWNLVYRVSRDKGNYLSPYTFGLTDSEKTEILNACSQQSDYIACEGVDTYSGDTQLGWHSLERKLIIKENSDTRPTVSMIATLNNGSLGSEFSDLYIQGKSRVNVTLSGQGKYNANIQGYTTVIDGNTDNRAIFTSDVIQKPGSQNIVGTVTDTRGFTNSVTQGINVIPYSKPLVIPLGGENAILCYRSDSDGVRVSNSTSFWVKAKRSYYTVTSGETQKNFCALQWRVKAADGSWSRWNDLISRTTLDTNEYNALIPNEVFNVKKTYTVQIRAIDDIGEYDIKTIDVPAQDVALHMGRGGNIVSVGRYCDYSYPESFQCNWDAYFNKGLFIENHGIRVYSDLSKLPNIPSGVSYARCLHFIGDQDNYYLLITSDGGLYVGTQLNFADSIDWKQK